MRLMNWAVTRDDGESQREITMRKVNMIWGGIVCLALLLGSCTGDKDGSSTTPQRQIEERTSSPEAVTTMVLKPTEFSYDVASNGKIGAGQYVDLRFASGGEVIDSIMVMNGQRVAKGQILATLNRFRLENAVGTAHNALERTRLDLADALIGQGYDPEKPTEIPDEVMRLARLRSGVAQSEVQLREAERALAEATLRAPFDGTVANLFQKEGNQPDGAQPLCRVISSAGMEVVFPILESELPLIKVGDAVEVMPYSSDRTYSGRVKSINPIVDNDGMVKVCATVSGGVGLYDGMNVRVIVKRQIEETLVIPKSAVVLRSGGRKVVFTHENGHAVWNYVTTSLENMDEYIITEGLKPGQEVIITGNINLAHESDVQVIDN